jgi:hypothetical protein
VVYYDRKLFHKTVRGLDAVKVPKQAFTAAFKEQQSAKAFFGYRKRESE